MEEDIAADHEVHLHMKEPEENINPRDDEFAEEKAIDVKYFPQKEKKKKQ
jgi:hypothetical protein